MSEWSELSRRAKDPDKDIKWVKLADYLGKEIYLERYKFWEVKKGQYKAYFVFTHDGGKYRATTTSRDFIDICLNEEDELNKLISEGKPLTIEEKETKSGRKVRVIK